MKYKSIFISDIHLGTRFSKANVLLNFLKHNSCDELFLVGDIIDGWAIKRKLIWPQAHSDVIQRILKKAKKGTKVTFITGNHDEFLRPFVPLILGKIILHTDVAICSNPPAPAHPITNAPIVHIV